MIVATRALEAEREAREAAAAERGRYGGMWSDDEDSEPADSQAGNDKHSQPVSRLAAADAQHHDSLTLCLVYLYASFIFAQLVHGACGAQ